MSSPGSSDSGSNPSLLYSHGSYIAAATKEAIGSYTSTDMQNAGSAEKQAAREQMRAAKQTDDASGGDVSKNPTLGKVEQSLGSAAGCEGMVEEGAKRQG